MTWHYFTRHTKYAYQPYVVFNENVKEIAANTKEI